MDPSPWLLVAAAASGPAADPAQQMAIKPILILCGLGLTVFYFIKLKSALLDRLLVAVSFLAMVVFILKPEWTDRIAARLGVEAGRHLLLYFTVVLYLFLILLLFSQLRKTHRDMTAVVRMAALLSARKPPSAPPAEEASAAGRAPAQ